MGKYIDVKPYLNHEVQVILNRGLVRTRRIEHKGILIKCEHHNLLLKSSWSKRVLIIKRPICNRDSIQIVDNTEEVQDATKM